MKSLHGVFARLVVGFQAPARKQKRCNFDWIVIAVLAILWESTEGAWFDLDTAMNGANAAADSLPYQKPKKYPSPEINWYPCLQASSLKTEGTQNYTRNNLRAHGQIRNV